MIKALQLIITPFPAWEKIALSQRGILWTLFTHLLPLAALTLAVEGYLLTRWGMSGSEMRMHRVVSPDLAARYAATYFLVLLGSVFITALVLKWSSESFNLSATYTQWFVVMAYGHSPIFLVRILDGIPQLNTWLCWAIGAVAAASVLYHGIGMMLRPEQTKGFGLYLMTAMILVLMTALAHFAAVSVLQRRGLPSSGTEAIQSHNLRQTSVGTVNFTKLSSGDPCGSFFNHPTALAQSDSRLLLAHTGQIQDYSNRAFAQFMVRGV
jgi:hypothetical protein